jgi:hypothetical protein
VPLVVGLAAESAERLVVCTAAATAEEIVEASIAAIVVAWTVFAALAQVLVPRGRVESSPPFDRSLSACLALVVVGLVPSVGSAASAPPVAAELAVAAMIDVVRVAVTIAAGRTAVLAA